MATVSHAISEVLSQSCDSYLLKTSFSWFSRHGSCGKNRADKIKRFSLLNEAKTDESLGWVLLYASIKACNGSTLWERIGSTFVDHPTFRANYTSRVNGYREAGQYLDRTQIVQSMIFENFNGNIDLNKNQRVQDLINHLNDSTTFNSSFLVNVFKPVEVTQETTETQENKSEIPAVEAQAVEAKA